MGRTGSHHSGWPRVLRCCSGGGIVRSRPRRLRWLGGARGPHRTAAAAAAPDHRGRGHAAVADRWRRSAGRGVRNGRGDSVGALDAGGPGRGGGVVQRRGRHGLGPGVVGSVGRKFDVQRGGWLPVPCPWAGLRAPLDVCTGGPGDRGWQSSRRRGGCRAGGPVVRGVDAGGVSGLSDRCHRVLGVGPVRPALSADIAGGVLSDLSGVDCLVFLAGRYALLAAGAAFAVPLFLGGGAGPVLPGWAWVLVKTVALLTVLVWLRRKLPMLRPDRFMEIGWMILLPAAVLQDLVVSLIVVGKG